MVGSNNLNKSAKFYDAVFVPLDIKKIKTKECPRGEIGRHEGLKTQPLQRLIVQGMSKATH